MKIKIDGIDTIYDADETPVYVYLTEADKKLIRDMFFNENVYAVYPTDESTDRDEIRANCISFKKDCKDIEETKADKSVG